MKIKLILLSTMFFALFSCVSPDYKEGGRYELEIGKQQLIPYQKGQKINFIHSKGYAFDLTVTSDTIVWLNNNEIPTCSPGFSFTKKTYYYDSFQVKTVQLKSDYPALGITLRVSADPNPYNNRLSLQINGLYSSIFFDKSYKMIPDTGYSTLHETILINNKTYNNVIETKLSGDPTMSVLYNELGLLQIKISDDETFSINN